LKIIKYKIKIEQDITDKIDKKENITNISLDISKIMPYHDANRIFSKLIER